MSGRRIADRLLLAQGPDSASLGDHGQQIPIIGNSRGRLHHPLDRDQPKEDTHSSSSSGVDSVGSVVISVPKELLGPVEAECITCGIPGHAVPTSLHPDSKDSYLLNILSFPPLPLLPILSAEGVSLRRTTCCKRVVCIRCFAKGVKSRVEADWLYQLGSTDWLKCTLQDCEDRGFGYSRVFIMPRGMKSDGSAGSRVANATRLRRDLESRRTGRSSTPEALNISSGFHTDLIRSGYMKVKWHAGVVTVLKIESKDGTRILKVPIFWDFFKRGYRKDCAICAETYSDVISDTPEDRASWEKILVDFPGPWPLRVRHFPPQSVLPECAKHHALDICIKCISRYMKQQVHSARGPVKCFMPDCGQVYAQKQVKLLAGAKTFRRWEKLQLAAVLSGQEGFLWCLRPGCRNGQIHDVPRLDDSIPEVNKIDCNHCGFLMCFKHQRAWHDGMTCREFDNFHLHGDPSIAETERLLRQQTKPCPKCGAPFMKAAGCFHMTCSRPNCRFEFCWECLADWEDVQRHGPTAHREGCYFRIRSAQEPLMLLGNSLEEAIRRLQVYESASGSTEANTKELCDRLSHFYDERQSTRQCERLREFHEFARQFFGGNG